MDARIRKAKESDLPAIAGLTTELIESVDNAEGLSINVLSKNYQILLGDPDSHILVAEVDETVIGIINFAVRRTLLHSGLSGLIDELVVTKVYRGKGIGKKLICSAVDKCRQLGCCEIEASTECTNTNARGFYKSCGFDERGVLLEKDLI